MKIDNTYAAVKDVPLDVVLLQQEDDNNNNNNNNNNKDIIIPILQQPLKDGNSKKSNKEKNNNNRDNDSIPNKPISSSSRVFPIIDLATEPLKEGPAIVEGGSVYSCRVSSRDGQFALKKISFHPSSAQIADEIEQEIIALGESQRYENIVMLLGYKREMHQFLLLSHRYDESLYKVWFIHSFLFHLSISLSIQPLSTLFSSYLDDRDEEFSVEIIS